MAINFGDLGSQIQSGVGQLQSNIGQFESQLQSGIGQLSTITSQVSNISNEFNALLSSQQNILAIPTRLLQEPLSAVSNELDVALNENLNQFQQSINNTIAQLDPALSFQLPNIANVATEVSTGINQIASQIDGDINDFVSNLGSVTNQITDNFSSQFGQLSGALSSVTEGLAGFTSAVPNFTQQLSSALPSLPADFGQVSQSFGNFNSQLQSAAGQVTGQLTGVLESASALTNPGQFLQGTLDNIVGAGLERIMGVVGNITNFGSLLANFLPGANRAISVLGDAIERVSTAFSGERLQDYVDSFEDIFESSDVSLFSSGALLSGGSGSSSLLGNQGFNSGASTSSKFATSAIPNPLRKHNTYNYIVTLGAISKNAYNTRSYVNSGLDNIILRSGGGKYNKRVRTAEEENLGEDLEYFIEDLEIDAVIAPNQNTGISLGTNISFKVIEPYSMSQFLEALLVSANASGYTNYINATFCLKIEFTGWDEHGKQTANYVETPIFIPIKIINMDFTVTASGAEYDVKAISFGEQATYDVYNTTQVQIGTNGITVADALENANNSVTGIMNDHLENLEQNQIPQAHRYLILFPKEESSIIDIVSGGAEVDISSLTTDPAVEEAIRRGVNTRTAPFRNEATAALVEDFVGAPPIYRKLKAFSLAESNINAIGLSALKLESNEGSNQTFTPASSAISNGRVFRFNPESEPAEFSRRFDYNEGIKITSIIEDIVLSSKYIKDAQERIRNNQPENGKYPWFRIEPMTFVEQTGQIENESGSTVNTYVFAVHPYFIDEAKLMAAGGSPSSTEELMQNAPKVYNYFYTGQNEDIINFDINFNMAFFNAIGGDLNRTGTQPGSETTAPADTQKDGTAPSVTNIPPNEPGPATVPVLQETLGPRGSRDGRVSDTERRRAQAIHNRILNSTVDMVTAEMEIWGDPYFIPNYQGNLNPGARQDGRALVGEDGTMRFMRDEVSVVINFRTPLDYQISGFIMNFPELVKPFSGLFNVWAVTNRFSEGKFVQTLKLIRRQGQSNDTGSRPIAVPAQTVEEINQRLSDIERGIQRGF